MNISRGKIPGAKKVVIYGVEGIGIVELNRKDIVRHKLVTRIVNAYEKYDNASVDS